MFVSFNGVKQIDMSRWKYKNMFTGTLQGCASSPRACQEYVCTGKMFTDCTLPSTVYITLYFGEGGPERQRGAAPADLLKLR
jgi:hypothetical protein